MATFDSFVEDFVFFYNFFAKLLINKHFTVDIIVTLDSVILTTSAESTSYSAQWLLGLISESTLK